MTKGTTAHGERHHRLHTICPRCGKHSLHRSKGTCASCAYPNSKMRKYNWNMKALRRRTTGVGRMEHLTEIHRKFAAGTLNK
uniref:Ribosomal protein L37 n=1 Tax=Trepomonas sp. PC1 TaxID=1076344 RepID=A0A146K665_9EUKA|eukprot:JAP91908.1 Ribosomal protein L37 [Trepomonas sp. PC1]